MRSDPYSKGPIPRHLIRVVPHEVPPVYEAYWGHFQALHPNWAFTTIADPVDPADWPLLGGQFDACVHGAQLAGLLRLEAVYHLGGIYVDMDMEPIRPLDALCELECFIGTEDGCLLTDAVFGAVPGHPAILACIQRAQSLDMAIGPLDTGPRNTTVALTPRNDVVVLPRPIFYPYRWDEEPCLHPSTLAVHRWAGSWTPEWGS